jgi:hypothetical protein
MEICTVRDFLKALDEAYKTYDTPGGWSDNTKGKSVKISNILLLKSRMYPSDDPRNLATHLDDPVPDFLIRKE